MGVARPNHSAAEELDVAVVEVVGNAFAAGSERTEGTIAGPAVTTRALVSRG